MALFTSLPGHRSAQMGTSKWAGTEQVAVRPVESTLLQAAMLLGGTLIGL